MHPLRRLAPHIWAVHGAVDLESRALETAFDDARVFTIVCEIFLDFCGTLRGVDSSCAALDDVGGAVELSRLATVPHGVEVLPFAHEIFGHYRVSAASAREACGFREGAKLDGAGLGAFDFKNRVRNAIFDDKALVGGVK